MRPGGRGAARLAANARPATRPLARGHYDRVVPECLFCGIVTGEVPADDVAARLTSERGPRGAFRVLAATHAHARGRSPGNREM